MAEAFGYLSKRLQMGDCGLFGRPRSQDPRLAIWLDSFNPIGVADVHEVDIATNRAGAQRPPMVRLQGSLSYAASQGWLVVKDDTLTLTTAGLAGA